MGNGNLSSGLGYLSFVIAIAVTPLQCSLGNISNELQSSNYKSQRIADGLDQIAESLKASNPQSRTENVRGDPNKPEVFYDTPQGRAYLQVDGIPIEEYLNQRK